MSAFPARYPGTCGVCDERFDESDLIRFSAADSSTNFVHDVCTEAPKPVIHPTCTDCWLAHPEGECDR